MASGNKIAITLILLTVIFTVPAAHPACSTPAASAGARNYASSKLQLCDGTNWLDFITNGTLGACGTAGQLEWDSATTAYKACYATTWNKIQQAPGCSVSSLTYQNKVTDATNLALVSTLKISADGTKLYASPQFTGRFSVWDASLAPAAPTLLGAVANANLVDTTDSVIAGNYAYVAARNTDNVVVIDISNPAAPAYVTRVQTSPTSELANIWGIALSADGNYLYTVSWDSGAGLNKCYFNVFDITTPSAPTEVGSLNVSDAGAGATTRYCNKIAVKGTTALLTFGEGLLVALDVSTPSAPSYITKVSATNGTNIDSVAFSEDGNTLFAVSYSTSRLHAFDVSNPSSPTWISSVLNSTYFNGAYGLVVSGNYAFSGGQTSDAVAAVDVSNPASMTVGANVVSATNLDGAGQIQKFRRFLFVGAIDGNAISVVDLGCDPALPNIGSCTNAKQVEYFSTLKALAYCDGKRWRTMAGNPPNLWLPMKTDATNIGSDSFTTSTNAITYGTVGSRNATVFAGVTGAGPGNRVNVTSNESALSLGTGDFTIEFWVYGNSWTAQPYVVDYRPLSNQTADFPAIRILSGGTVALQAINAGAASNVYTTAASISTGAWNHVALVRASGTMKFYLNGTASGSYSTVRTFAILAGSTRPEIGSSGWSHSSTLDGYLYDVKIYVGRAVYTANFTPTP